MFDGVNPCKLARNQAQQQIPAFIGIIHESGMDEPKNETRLAFNVYPLVSIQKAIENNNL